MNDFKNSIQVRIEGINKVYEIRDVYLRENHNTGECMAYSTKNSEKVDDTSIEVFLANIEDESDIISYKILCLPGGRSKRINEQKDEFNLYNFGNVFEALSGESLSSYDKITKSQIDKLIERYRSEKPLMKYFELEMVTFFGEDAYIGKYLEQGRRGEEELFGNVLSKIDLENIKNQKSQVIITNEHLQDFKLQDCTLKFTARALQNIIEKDKNRGK